MNNAFQNKNETGKKVRNANIDVLKSIAIFLVILGHTIQCSKGQVYGQYLFYNNILFRTIYSFHMPLFMLISGYLFYYSLKKYSTKKLVFGKICSLIIPIVSWTLLFNLLIPAINGSIPSISDIIFIILNAFWFLWAVFYCSIGTTIGNRIFKDNILFHLIVIIILMIIPNKYNKDYYGYLYPYFLIGYYANKYQVKCNKKNFLISIIGYMAMMMFWDNKYYIYISGFSLVNKSSALTQVGVNIYRWVIGLLGSIILIWLIDKLSEKYVAQKYEVFSNIGGSTMGIYILNFYISNYLLTRIELMSYLSEGLYTIICILLSILILYISILSIRLIRLSTILNKLFLGAK